MTTDSFAHYYRLLAGISLLAGAALMGIGYLPTVRTAGSEGLTSMIYGVGVTLIASLIGAIPLCSALANEHDKIPTAALMATAIRFLVVLGAVPALVFSGFVERVPFVVWAAISYLLLLLLDTLASVHLMKRVQGIHR